MTSKGAFDLWENYDLRKAHSLKVRNDLVDKHDLWVNTGLRAAYYIWLNTDLGEAHE